MITGDPFAWVVREISLLAEDHPLSVTSIRDGGTTMVALKNRYDGFNASLEVLGTYDQIGAFIQDIENRFVTSKITSLRVAGAAGGKHSASFQITWLIVPEPKTIGPVEKKSATSKTEERPS